jgi:ATP-dependent RNA helicase DHX8/PRP22
MPEQGERSLAADLRGIGVEATEMPEWKQKSFGGNVSFGIVTKKSLMEQRKSLPIYQLKDKLCEAFVNHQVLVVIGETGE